jgi:dienelactone hydrolase
MAINILIAALVIETVFALFSILTRSDLSKVRGLIRIGALAAFVLLILTALIQWGFRWYVLAALLVLWALLGIGALLSRQAQQNAYRAGPTVVRAVTTLLLVGIAVTPALILPQYTPPPVTGKHPVATAQFTYTDIKRTETFTHTGEARKVNVEFWYPKDDEVGSGKYPLVVFSHGAFGMKASNTSTFMELASNGYVVCAIDHPYHALFSLFTLSDDNRLAIVDQAYLQEVLDVNNGKYDDAARFKLEQQWMQLRTADIQFVLNTILAQVKKADAGAVYQLVDTTKIGLMGHSLGGESSAQVARQRDDISAVVNLDADLHGEYLDYVDGKYVLNDTVYPTPILTILSDVMTNLLAAVPDAKDVVAVEHVTATAPQAYEVRLPGTDHMSLTDLPLVSPFFVSLINRAVPQGAGVEADAYGTLVKMNELVLAFFNATLKGEGSFSVAGE